MISHSRRAKYELAQIIEQYGADFKSTHKISWLQEKTLQAIADCRTYRLGGHVDGCTICGHIKVSYNSCRNRHCPKCQTTHRERWIIGRKEELLNAPYYHVVFTIPDSLHCYCQQYPRLMYDILFRASKETLLSLGRDHKYLGADMGCISILHTWGLNLQLHPHIHMIVPAGGMSRDGIWKSTRRDGNFLFPIKAMSIIFKHKFMAELCQMTKGMNKPVKPQLRKKLYAQNWNVYAKQPFYGPEQVIEYLARYSHKIAISNHRIKSISGGQVTFDYKDYKKGGKKGRMTLDSKEFLRRFCMHILPSGFMKIRHYGILSNRNKKKIRFIQMMQGIIPQKRKINFRELCMNYLDYDPDQCPCCKSGKMITLLHFAAHAPPHDLTILKLLLQSKISQLLAS